MITDPSASPGPGLESPTLWRRARDVFDRLATWTGVAGEAVLEREELDPELRRAVGKLLDHDRSDDFLEIPWSPPEPRSADSGDDPWIGSRMGPYRLVREIGRGGSGVVYLGERDDAEFEHQVAVKVLSQAPSRGARQRFLRERQILARLEHPNIARLIGGGSVPEGLPYVIMELVDGLPVTGWCDCRQLSIEGRLELFCDVCDAVQYAHRNLVVHRDLKPSNILVTAAGQVKLLDFGIAKPLDAGPPGEEPGDPTLVMTPSYASPEQILGRNITTSSDVYSLGVLLYEILCGHRPHEGVRGELLGLEARVRVPAPSQALDRGIADGDHAALLAPAASARGLSAQQLRRRLKGDLDHIVMRALRQEPDQRWVSVEQMAADVRRHLAGSPVEARRGSVLYHAAKFVRRNRVAVLVAAVLGVLVLGFAVLASWQASLRAEERDLARQEKIKAETVADTLIDLFQLLEPRSGHEYNEAGKAVLDQGSRRIDRDFADQPEIRATLHHALGSIYLGLGFFTEAERSLDIALSQRRLLLGAEHPEVADTLRLFGKLREVQGRFSEAETLLDEALEILRRRFKGDHEKVASVLTVLGTTAAQEGEYPAAERWLSDAIDMSRRLGNHDSPNMAGRLNSLGLVLRRQGRTAEAEKIYRQALEIYRQSQGEESLNVGGTLNNLAGLAFARGDLAASIESFREALEIWRSLRGDEHPDVQVIVSNLAVVLHQTGDTAAAEPLYRESLAYRRRRLGDEHPDVALGLSNLGALLRDMGRAEEARVSLEEALAQRRKLLGSDHPDVAGTLHLLGLVELDAGHLDRARELFNEALAINRARRGEQHRQTAISFGCLAKLALASGQPQEALRRVSEAEDILAQALPEWHWRRAEMESLRGEALGLLGRSEAARELLTRSLARIEQVRGQGSLAAREAAARLARLGHVPR